MSRIPFVLYLWVAVSVFGSAVADAAGNSVKGKRLAITCLSCHGENGISSAPLWPNLAGQKPAYLSQQLQAYRSHSRSNPIMSPLAEGLSDEDMEDLAAFFASLPL